MQRVWGAGTNVAHALDLLSGPLSVAPVEPVSLGLLCLSTAQLLTDFYVVGHQIGKGSYGEVFLGHDIITHEPCAVKVIKKNPFNRKQKKFIERESAIMKTVDNDYIVQTLDVFETDGDAGTLTIVSEYCGGGELFDLIIASQCFTEDKARHIMQQVLLGVDYLHSRGIVHRYGWGVQCRGRRGVRLCAARIGTGGLTILRVHCCGVFYCLLTAAPRRIPVSLVFSVVNVSSYFAGTSSQKTSWPARQCGPSMSSSQYVDKDCLMPWSFVRMASSPASVLRAAREHRATPSLA